MELTPHGNSAKNSISSAECRCPPGTAQLVDSSSTSPCYKLFDQGPCELGEFFAPIADSTDAKTIMFDMIFFLFYKIFNSTIFLFDFVDQRNVKAFARHHYLVQMEWCDGHKIQNVIRCTRKDRAPKEN